MCHRAACHRACAGCVGLLRVGPCRCRRRVVSAVSAVSAVWGSRAGLVSVSGPCRVGRSGRVGRAGISCRPRFGVGAVPCRVVSRVGRVGISRVGLVSVSGRVGRVGPCRDLVSARVGCVGISCRLVSAVSGSRVGCVGRRPVSWATQNYPNPLFSWCFQHSGVRNELRRRLGLRRLWRPAGQIPCRCRHGRVGLVSVSGRAVMGRVGRVGRVGFSCRPVSAVSGRVGVGPVPCRPCRPCRAVSGSRVGIVSGSVPCRVGSCRVSSVSGLPVSARVGVGLCRVGLVSRVGCVGIARVGPVSCRAVSCRSCRGRVGIEPVPPGTVSRATRPSVSLLETVSPRHRAVSLRVCSAPCREA